MRLTWAGSAGRRAGGQTGCPLPSQTPDLLQRDAHSSLLTARTTDDGRWPFPAHQTQEALTSEVEGEVVTTNGQNQTRGKLIQKSVLAKWHLEER